MSKGYAKRVLDDKILEPVRGSWREKPYGITVDELKEMYKSKFTVANKIKYGTQFRGVSLKDGIYTDYSKRDSLVLGFALVRGGKVICSCSCAGRGGHGERQAVELAKEIVDSAAIYCDHIETVNLTGVNYVPRSLNPAHAAAYRKINLTDVAGVKVLLGKL